LGSPKNLSVLKITIFLGVKNIIFHYKEPFMEWKVSMNAKGYSIINANKEPSFSRVWLNINQI